MSEAVTIKGWENFKRTMALYEQVVKKTSDEVLLKKTNDMRIQLGKAFYEKRYKPVPGAYDFKAHGGIDVRLGKASSKYAGAIPDKDKRGRPLSEYQRSVAQELLRRAAGSGLLGISFWLKRRRKLKHGTKLVTNNSRMIGALMRITTDYKSDEKGSFSTATIDGLTPGLRTISDRYGILDRVVQDMTDDMIKYLSERIDRIPQPKGV